MTNETEETMEEIEKMVEEADLRIVAESLRRQINEYYDSKYGE